MALRAETELAIHARSATEGYSGRITLTTPQFANEMDPDQCRPLAPREAIISRSEMTTLPARMAGLCTPAVLAFLIRRDSPAKYWRAR